MLACTTPPVATAIAGSNPVTTSVYSTRLEIVLFFIPFFFVFGPALISQGSIREMLYLLIMCLIGIFFIGSGLEGYVLRIGRVSDG